MTETVTREINNVIDAIDAQTDVAVARLGEGQQAKLHGGNAASPSSPAWSPPSPP